MKQDLLKNIDLTASRLKPYEGFIFLCGGPTDIRSVEPVSIRDAVYRELAKDKLVAPRIRIAEHYKNWGEDSLYRDLVSFERHLAELSSVIVLVLESAGSLTELGLFAAIDEFQSKLLVFIETEHYKDASFIRLGPVDFLEKTHGNVAECHRWIATVDRTSSFDPKAAIDLQPDLAAAVRARTTQPTKERSFEPTKWLDRALLVCDLLNLTSALTLRELKQLFDGFGITKTETEMRQTLFLLERVGLLAMEPKGDQRFYVSIDSKRYLRLGISNLAFDLSRFKIDQLGLYEREDKKRFRAIRDARSRHAKR